MSARKHEGEAEARLLSVIITTYNEEVNVGDCIESALWADEILVVDSYSTDRTVEIAKGYPVTVLQREYFGSAAQKNWSLDRVRNDWVLIVDADERVTPELAEEIQGILAVTPRAFGYYIRRKNVMLGKVIKHSGWSTDKVIRLFDRAHGRYPNRRVHADLDIDGDVPTLKSSLLHYTYRTFDQYFQKLMNYAARRWPFRREAMIGSSSSRPRPNRAEPERDFDGQPTSRATSPRRWSSP